MRSSSRVPHIGEVVWSNGTNILISQHRDGYVPIAIIADVTDTDWGAVSLRDSSEQEFIDSCEYVYANVLGDGMVLCERAWLPSDVFDGIPCADQQLAYVSEVDTLAPSPHDPGRSWMYRECGALASRGPSRWHAATAGELGCVLAHQGTLNREIRRLNSELRADFKELEPRTYWTSTQSSDESAWQIDFRTGLIDKELKIVWRPTRLFMRRRL
jgi:hypothetical protein